MLLGSAQCNSGNRGLHNDITIWKVEINIDQATNDFILVPLRYLFPTVREMEIQNGLRLSASRVLDIAVTQWLPTSDNW